MEGQLTRQGYDMALNLGRWLRQRYVSQLGALPAALDASALRARTTMIRRTIATLRGVLTGADSCREWHLDSWLAVFFIWLAGFIIWSLH